MVLTACSDLVVIVTMPAAPQKNLKDLRISLGITQGEIAEKLGVKQAAVSGIEVRNHIPRAATVTGWLTAINAILADRGSDRRVSYDELWAAFCVGRLHVLPPLSPKPDLSAGLAALGDLSAVDHSTTAPSAQGA
jgi:transcriptional regulator with XRE-family HTH domain